MLRRFSRCELEKDYLTSTADNRINELNKMLKAK